MWMLLLPLCLYNLCFCENKSQRVCRSLDLLKMNRAKETFHIIYESKNVCSCLAAGTIIHCNWELKRTVWDHFNSMNIAFVVVVGVFNAISLIVARKSLLKIAFKKKQNNISVSAVKCDDNRLQNRKLVHISRFFGANALNKTKFSSIKHKSHSQYKKKMSEYLIGSKTMNKWVKFMICVVRKLSQQFIRQADERNLQWIIRLQQAIEREKKTKH